MFCLRSGKLNSSLSSSTGPAPSSSRPANQSRPRRSALYTAAEAASSGTGCRSLSFHGRRPSEGERGRPGRSAPLKRAETTPLQPTPPKRLLQRTGSVSSSGSGWLQNGLTSRARPETPVFMTPGSEGESPSALLFTSFRHLTCWLTANVHLGDNVSPNISAASSTLADSSLEF